MGKSTKTVSGFALGCPLRLCRFFRCGFFPFDRKQHFLLTCGNLPWLLVLGGRGLARQTFLQRVHEVYNVLTAGPRFSTDSFALALGINEFGQCLFVVVLETLWLEVGCFLIDDVLRQIKHVLRNFPVLDFVEVFLLVADFVGVSQERPHQTLLQRL